MKQLEGIHHVTAITGNAPVNLDFYTRVLGLRLVKKTVNQDDPSVYHLFYADEKGSAGSDLTFFEYPGLVRGRPGAGMVHRIVWRVGSAQALDFWERRLAAEHVNCSRGDGRILFSDPEGLDLELEVDRSRDDPLIADHPEIPSELALRGFAGVRAFTAEPDKSRRLLGQTLGFGTSDGRTYEVRGDHRGSFYTYDEAPAPRGLAGAGTVHHVAWASAIEDHEAWRQRVVEGGAAPTPIIDRYYFRSIYFREPSGVLFEIATLGPGFATDEPAEHLGERLSLPPKFEHLRAQLEPVLTPLSNPRESWIRR
jgi:glyoxalase family protein